MVVPQNGWFIMEKPIKMGDLGAPPFKETPIYICIYIYIYVYTLLNNIPHRKSMDPIIFLRPHQRIFSTLGQKRSGSEDRLRYFFGYQETGWWF